MNILDADVSDMPGFKVSAFECTDHLSLRHMLTI
jgi:hypothetical protein